MAGAETFPAFVSSIMTSLFEPDEANAKVREDIVDVVAKAIGGKNYARKKAGTIESDVAKGQLLGGAEKYKADKDGNIRGYFSRHGLSQRNSENGWTAEQIAKIYGDVFDSADTVAIPNVLGIEPSATEALWNPKGFNGKSAYMPIVPYKDGFKVVTVYDPTANHVGSVLKRMGYWEGGPTSSIYTPTLETPAKRLAAEPFSAVNNPFRGMKVQDVVQKGKAVGSVGVASTLYPNESLGADYVPKEKGLEQPFIDPIDIGLAPVGVAGKGAKTGAMATSAAIGAMLEKLFGE